MKKLLLLSTLLTSPTYACTAVDEASLMACNDAPSGNLTFGADITVTTCGDAAIVIDNTTNFTVAGNNYTLFVRGPQKTCPAISATNSSGAIIRDLMIDEDPTISPCGVRDNCTNAIRISGAKNILFDNVQVYFAKGNALAGQNVTGFTWQRSTLSEIGILGLYLYNSSDINVLDSLFSKVCVNAIAFDTIGGTNKINYNYFSRNQYLGRFMNDNVSPPAPYTGGQIYISHGKGNTSVQNNTITGGNCAICDNPQVPAFELGGNKGYLSNTKFMNNLIMDTNGPAFIRDQGATLSASVNIHDNTVVHTTEGLAYPSPNSEDLIGATVYKNTVQP